jgi:hypothetical protein
MTQNMQNSQLAHELSQNENRGSDQCFRGLRVMLLVNCKEDGFRSENSKVYDAKNMSLRAHCVLAQNLL